ncbi:bifunctional 2-C-methyl-D-erythritol 4-phosphate cytidylyltransferase/2-C-methyl-D-erythritol 2,4-cyclodiphosphate synthase [Abyssibius alkaniclasticus]|uniref:bifunctional 2-C-methyl-D-erythritol 4-phosphate cytidylyltransferase/2-C-methyl-D-erythritol 2,4-cyclodiphosphate synthase n=1 Tax=Abyssibius alkaniclasticus TaxID=2881234 RepID=UPI0023638EB2|nr:bifunctional 2-C-methyl-D-erythritol 4-phosphate cytidylyltransferase/2-C-methyl-D-erythritol 2,4-cyclodiphosphate synthase [Abyssibius alkaniclasticus]UPH70642.1 bifunctional 2-C-methyl-D-erythritol 4-phosphate cytidylyltransferase/2-C-methyl-D-erythritol 2,4-cyclodiphosphate synthase [Abyssibius alkaniclasticus]
MQKTRKTAGLIVAAGTGRRAGGGLPKQFRMLGGEMVLQRAARAMLAFEGLEVLQVVAAPEWLEKTDEALAILGDTRILPGVAGGDTRQESVLAGLEALTAQTPDLVLIHDAARPFLKTETIAHVVKALETAPGAVPCLPLVDALWHGGAAGLSSPQPRENLFRAQTPQGFQFAAILVAHRKAAPGMLDDAAIARAAGLQVALVPGDAQNIKLTLPEDFAALQERFMDIRCGNGFDVHAFCAGTHVTLCGLRLAHDRALAGHSDADVGLHALTDAIFGALAEGDIGQWFPPSDARWKGAASDIFLRKAVERARIRGFAITHLDCTLICEAPKIGPHAPKMRARVAEICGLDIDRVSIKATTSEKLGFTGREEGIAAMATATLVAQ